MHVVVAALFYDTKYDMVEWLYGLPAKGIVSHLSFKLL
jgi:hypothetical protein